jgi:hypothetical protein
VQDRLLSDHDLLTVHFAGLPQATTALSIMFMGPVSDLVGGVVIRQAEAFMARREGS